MDSETFQRRSRTNSTHNNNNNAVVGKERLNRSEVLAKKKAIEQLIKAANAKIDQLAFFLSHRHFKINGLSLCLKSGHGNKLSSPVKRYIQNLLKLNMEGPYGSEWQEEEKVKRREMVDPKARYIFVHEVVNSNADDMTTVLTEEDTSTSRQEDSGPLGKGLGMFLMELIELIAQKNCMGAVMLTVQKANLLAMNFYMSKLRYMISATSPSKVNPMLEKSYEILCRTFDDEAKTILEVKHSVHH
ncbi:N-terminal L-serine N(alpha)-acetyltransferase NatD [Trifolium repens]|nr:N-terminal L-serine N(alpha)-acetyltransferase NatD [Trifolium repens]